MHFSCQKMMVPSAPSAEAVNGQVPEMEEPVRRDTSHMVYAVEMLIFSFIGWGWLAVREFLSDTPVSDVSLFVALLVTSVLNMAFALTFSTVEVFLPCANAFLSHTIAVFVFYIYSLMESTYGGTLTLCCKANGTDVSTFTVVSTYREAFFGGFSLHQPAAAVTMAFVVIFLILAAGQVRVCSREPKSWVMRGVALSIAILVSLHVVLMVIYTPTCVRYGEVAYTVIAMIVLTGLLMVDFHWISLFIDDADENFFKVLQIWLEIFSLVMLMCFSNILSASLTGTLSIPLIGLSVVLLVVHVVVCSLQYNSYFSLYYLDIKVRKYEDTPTAKSASRYPQGGRQLLSMRVPMMGQLKSTRLRRTSRDS